MGLDRVVVAAAVSLARDVAASGQLVDERCAALSVIPTLSPISRRRILVMRNADQHLGVVGQKRPLGRFGG